MTHSRIAEVDPVAIVMTELLAAPSLLALLGPGGADHLSGLNEPPYPHLQVTPSTNGEDGRLMWASTGEVNLLLWGELDGRPGSKALRDLLYEVVGYLARIPDRDYVPGRPVVTDVRAVASARWAPDRASEQPCWAHTLQIAAHPRKPDA